MNRWHINTSSISNQHKAEQRMSTQEFDITLAVWNVDSYIWFEGSHSSTTQFTHTLLLSHTIQVANQHITEL